MAGALSPGPDEPTLEHWLAGVHAGREVLAFWGPGLGYDPPQARVVVRIDPPLLLGLAIYPPPPEEALGGEVVADPGRPLLQAKAVSPGRANAILFDPAVHRELGQVMSSRGSARVPYVTDSFAAIATGGFVPDLDATIRQAGAIADAVVAARAALPPDHEEVERRAAWRRYAAEAALAFDPERMVLSGDSAGVATEARLRARDGAMWIEVAASFGAPLGVDLSIEREAPQQTFFTRIFKREVEIGAPAFDEAFEIHGAPSARVRELLGGDDVRARLLGVDASALEVACNDTHVAAAFPATIDVRRAIADVTAVAAALAAKGPALGGPYRA